MNNSKAAILGGTPVFGSPLPFARPTLPAFEEVEKGIRSIMESGMLTKGPYLEAFEEMVAEYQDVPFALGVANCTLGLFMLIKALGLKGEVIVPSYSFMATFHVVELAGLTPVFVDCERDTFTIDPKGAENAITDKTSAILGVCIFGNPPDIRNIEKIAEKHNLKFIMDSAHSFGTLYYSRPMGCFGDGEVFSTSPTKLLATGEGGVVTTKHEDVSRFIKIYREYGNTGDYDCRLAGINARMSEFHALMGTILLPKIEQFAESRNRIARFYIDNLDTIPGVDFQKIRDGCHSSYKDFAVTIDETLFGLNRNQLVECLRAEGISTRRYFDPPGHRMSCYQKYGPHDKDDFVNTDYLANHTLILPIFSHMDQSLAENIVEAFDRIYRWREDIAKLNLESKPDWSIT